MSNNMTTGATAKGGENGVAQATGLALLEKNAEEQAQFADEVEKILAFVGEVQSVDTDDKGRDDGKTNIFREDTVTVETGVYREKMLAQAPSSFKKWFLSKKIL